MSFKKEQQAIAILNITGRISDANALAIFMALRRVEWSRQGIAGILLRVCSEGGSLAAAQAICESLALLQKELGIAIACVVEDMAVSAAFYMALGADFVTATPAATLGAVGAVVGTYDVRGLESRLGIGYRSTASAPLKTELDMHGKPSEEGQVALQGLVDDVHDQFVEWIRDRRSLPALPAHATDGRMFTGRQAHAMGLIDATGGSAVAIEYLLEKTGIAQPAFITIETQSGGHWAAKLVEQLPFGRLLSRVLGLRS